MTTRRHQLATSAGRLRLLRTAGEILCNLIPDAADELLPSATAISARLYEVGLPWATPAVLAQYAQALDNLDGLSTGRYDLAYLLPDLTASHDQEVVRDRLEQGFMDDVDFLERLVVVLGPRAGS